MKSNKRNILFYILGLILICLFVIPDVQAASVATLSRKADAAFDKKLKSISSKSQNSLRYRYVDITGDKIHEALVEYKPKTQEGSGETFDVYAYSNGSVKRILTIKEYGLSRCIFYKKTKTLILYSAGHGGEGYGYYQMKKNGNYRFVASKGRNAIAGGGTDNGPWQYFKANTATTATKITAKQFRSLTAKLKSGTKNSFSSWKVFYRIV